MDLIDGSRETAPDTPLLCCDAARAYSLRDRCETHTRLVDAFEPFRAFASPVRVRLAAALLDLGELCVADASWICETSVALASHHLKVLLDAQLVERRRNGKLMMYRLTPAGEGTLETILGHAA